MYVELHARSAFSFLEAASNPEDLVEAAAEQGLAAMALVDRDGVYGAPRFHQAARKAGVRAHIGAELTCTDGFRYPLLAATRTGYQNLCRLITRMKLRARKGEGAVQPGELAEFAEGLICLAPHPDVDFTRLKQAFGPGNVYAELQRHYCREQEARNQRMAARAEAEGVPLAATNGVGYATPARREVYDALTCIRHKVKLAEAGRLLDRNAERYVKSPAAMARLFADYPQAIRNTREISDRLEFTLEDLGYEFPRYPVGPGETMDAFLRDRVWEGARQRYRPLHERARRQIERELKLIEKLGLAGYFLIVWDLVQFCRRENILAQGRGSAANSAVCYSLGITAVDPVGMELLFERFLSEERGEWPDIDLDLPSGEQRERVIQYVYQRYGRLGAAMTANVITYRGRSAAREMGKVLGFDEETTARLSSLAHRWEWKDPRDTPEKRFALAGLDLRDPRIRKFLELYLGVQDLPRHLGQHSGGMVICQGQLDSVVPLEPAAMPGRVVVQWDKEDCADLGIIKVDLLGLGMMAVLEDSIHVIRDVHREEVDLARLPPDDPQVYAALQAADTVGMFQVESRAQMSCLPRLRPRTFYDIVVQVAIIRPGPIVGKMVHPYLNRRQGKEPVDYPHPSLEPVLRRTLGVPLFQEQLLRMAMIVANFTGGEAEELRRAMGFKRSEKRMREIERKLREGMARNGITGEVQDRIVQSISSFALYGFPESHAASFALLAYASAYLKTYYPAAFTASLLNNQPMGFYHPATLVKDAQRHGLRVLPVDVAYSDVRCTVLDKGTMRLGLNYLRGLRAAVAGAIVRQRAKCPFVSVDDLVRRVPELHRDELRKLAAAGALNTLEATHRRGALWQVERAARRAGPLLDHPALEAASAREAPLRPMTDAERLASDFRETGLTIGRHPLHYLRAQLADPRLRTAAELARLPHGRWVKVAGCVIVRQRPGTAKGFVFLSLEDETGVANVIVEPRIFEQSREEWTRAPFVAVEGVLQRQDGVISVKARKVTPLPAAAMVAAHDFH
jgi:error-prone DNA polymerase